MRSNVQIIIAARACKKIDTEPPEREQMRRTTKKPRSAKRNFFTTRRKRGAADAQKAWNKESLWRTGSDAVSTALECKWRSDKVARPCKKKSNETVGPRAKEPRAEERLAKLSGKSREKVAPDWKPR